MNKTNNYRPQRHWHIDLHDFKMGYPSGQPWSVSGRGVHLVLKGLEYHSMMIQVIL